MAKYLVEVAPEEVATVRDMLAAMSVPQRHVWIKERMRQQAKAKTDATKKRHADLRAALSVAFPGVRFAIRVPASATVRKEGKTEVEWIEGTADKEAVRAVVISAGCIPYLSVESARFFRG